MWIKERVTEIDALLEPHAGTLVIDVHGSNVELDQPEAKLVLVTALMLAKATGPTTPEQGRERGRAYMTALDDVPAWALAGAIDKWHRGEVTGIEERDFKWVPDTVVLRRVAREQTSTLARLRLELQRALDAVPLEEAMR